MASLRELDVEEVGMSFFRHCTDPKALYVTLIERWWVIAVCSLVGVVVGAVTIKTAVKQFSSHGKLLVYQKLPTFMDDSTRNVDPKAYDSLFATHVQLMGSSLIVDKAVEKFELRKLEVLDEIHAKHRELGNKSIGDVIRETLKVRRAGSGDSAGAFVLSLEFAHPSAKECPQVVDAVLQTYKQYVNTSMLDDQGKAVQLLQVMKTEIQNEVQQKAKAYRDFLKSAPGVWDRDTLTNTHQKRVEAFELELTELEIKQQTIGSRIEILDRKTHPKTGLPLTDMQRLALVDDIHLPRIEVLISVQGDKVSEILQGAYPERQEVASARYDDLLQMLVDANAVAANVGKKHPKYVDAMADIKLLEFEIQKRELKSDTLKRPAELTPTDLVSAYEVLLWEEMRDVARRIEFVKEKIEVEIAASKTLYDYSIEARQLEDDYDRTRELSGVLLDKMQKQSLLNQFGSYVAEIVEHPSKGQLTWPKKPIILALCTLVGFFAGSFFALALDLIQFSPLVNLFGFLPDWLVRKEPMPGQGHTVT
jgi:uncharacterized protein involved in exopolysaccharide biosynthesis